LKKTMIAIAALGIVGAASLTPTAPAGAFFVCAKNSKHAKSDRCTQRAQQRAERRAKWQEFWQSLFPKRKKRG
ncbi:MAG: hypothetical protein ACE5FM_06090, partial [Methyloligellaceae bacterium]